MENTTFRMKRTQLGFILGTLTLTVIENNVVQKMAFFSIFALSFLGFKKSVCQSNFSDLLPSCNELLVSNLIGSGKLFMIIEKALSKFA